MDFFTSDLHIGHDKDFLYQKRGFINITEHDTQIIKNWNSIITPEDNVYILGDLCMSSNEAEWNRVFYNLNGHLFFIRGNHDTDNKIITYINAWNITNLGFVYIYKYNKKKQFYLSHYPTMVGNKDNKYFFWNLSGHTHNKNKFQYGEKQIYNVALDAHNMFPISIEDIIKDIDNYKENII